MPQPLSRVKRNAGIELDMGGLMAHPEFAAAISGLISGWAYIDATLAGMFANFMRADVAAAAAMYQALNGSEAKRAVLLAAAGANHPEWQSIMLSAVLKAVKPSREQRNDFAHNIWAWSKDLPDAVLLIPPAAYTEVRVKRREGNDLFMAGQEVPDEKLSPDFDRAKVQVYRKADFDRAISDGSMAFHLVTLLSHSIGEHRTEQARRQLLTEPLVQQALQPMIREKSPEVQAQLRAPVDGAPPPRGIHRLWDEYWDRVERGEIEPLESPRRKAPPD